MTPKHCPKCGCLMTVDDEGAPYHRGKHWAETDLTFCLKRQLDASNERISMLEDAVSRALAMRQKWLETPGEAHAGAYYAFVKGRDADWEIISKAKEDKP